MKKTVLLCTLAAIVSFAAGFCMSQIMHSNDAEIIKVQDAALTKASIIMDRHNLWDYDGSDEMADYLDLCFTADSLMAQ